MNLVNHSILCINVAKARRIKLTLKEKMNLTDASRIQSQR